MAEMNQNPMSVNPGSGNASTPTPAPTPVPPPVPAPKTLVGKNAAIGPVAAIVLILALIMAGGLYYYAVMSEAANPEGLPTAEDIQKSDDPEVQAALQQSSSDEVADIEADAEATDFTSIDAAMSDLDSASTEQ